MIRSWLEKARWDKAPTGKGPRGWLYLLGDQDAKLIQRIVNQHAMNWQKPDLLKSPRDLLQFTGKSGPVWILRQRKKASAVSHSGLLEESPYTFFRDGVGAMVASWKAMGLAQVACELHGTNAEQELGTFTGLEIASYHFRDEQADQSLKGLPLMWIKTARGKVNRALVKQAQARGAAVNLARHLVNLPPNHLHPGSYASMVKGTKWAAGMKVEVWDTKRLKKEGMGLLLGVGQGAENPPCMIHLRWRPKGSSSRKPIAFVGKGITFDSGGLDLKPASGMRLMKKDMGGSAAVMGIARWVSDSNYPHPVDFYLAVAENAVDSRAFRPSDILIARNGARVEIDNTDAEGRLVLADALDVAITQKGADEPEAVIDIATLTGAIKVGLGAEIAGLFSNDDALADAINRAGTKAGDLSWRMPLAERYWASMSSPFADFKNSASDGFGGAITAALFLARFVKTKSWVHLDIYAWTDKSSGALLSSGGSGQSVQNLIEWLESRD